MDSFHSIESVATNGTIRSITHIFEIFYFRILSLGVENRPSRFGETNTNSVHEHQSSIIQARPTKLGRCALTNHFFLESTTYSTIATRIIRRKRLNMTKFTSFVAQLLLAIPMTYAYLDEHGPRDRFWRHNQEEKTLIVDGKNRYGDLEQCIQNSLTDEERAAIKNDTAVHRRVSQTHNDPHRGWTMLVNIEQAIAPSHAKAVQTLAACVRQTIPGSYESRSMSVEMGFQSDVGLGGNCPTHLAPLIQMWFPEVFDEMHRTLELAYEAAGWSAYLPEKGYEYMSTLPDPKDVGFRATEHLTYNDFKGKFCCIVSSYLQSERLLKVIA